MNKQRSMSNKQVEALLQQLDTLVTKGLQADAWKWEQYSTPPRLAIEALRAIQDSYGDVEGKRILDLGCGTGILAFGCILLGALHVTAVDIDKRCIDILEDNIENCGSWISHDVIEGQQLDVCSLSTSDITKSIDVVIMNPPFGTKCNVGTDKLFVRKALEFADIVYSFHKSSNREYWKQKDHGIDCKSIIPFLEMKFTIQNCFDFHSHSEMEILVDLIQFKK